MKKVLLAGLLGGMTLNFVMLLTFRLIGFGWNGNGVLLDPSIQSPKLIAVWTKLEPLPLVVNPKNAVDFNKQGHSRLQSL